MRSGLPHVVQERPEPLAASLLHIQGAFQGGGGNDARFYQQIADRFFLQPWSILGHSHVLRDRGTLYLKRRIILHRSATEAQRCFSREPNG